MAKAFHTDRPLRETWECIDSNLFVLAPTSMPLNVLKLDLIAQQVLEDVAAADEAGLTVFDEDFGRFIPGVKV
jgi:hypothetical protein